MILINEKVFYNKKGFTLIELLTAILILSIITLISVPVVTKLVDQSKKSAYKTSVMHLFAAADTYLYSNDYIDMPSEGIEIQTLDTIKPNNFITGYIYKNINGNYEVADVSDGKYCANGELENLIITKGTCDLEDPVLVIIIDKNIANLTLTDNKSLSGYVCTNSESMPTNWVTIQGNETTVACEFDEVGTYYVWVKDESNNIVRETISLDEAAFCAYPVGQTWNFVYAPSNVQNFTVPCEGTYKLEVWGAQGNYSLGGSSYYSSIGGLGGYSQGTLELNKADIYYIVVGGQDGYNGGGGSGRSWAGANGGGATHIAKVSGIIKNIGYNSFVTQNNGIIVAGGGGGGGATTTGANICEGGSGGGLTGSNGERYTASQPIGYGATQTTGGTGDTSGSFGQGGVNQYVIVGGGGGLYGGGAGYYWNGGSGAGGGSGYLSSLLTSSSMTNGTRTGSGYATITLLSYE